MKSFKFRLMSLWRRNKTVTIRAENKRSAERIAEKIYRLDYEIIIPF